MNPLLLSKTPRLWPLILRFVAACAFSLQTGIASDTESFDSFDKISVQSFEGGVELHTTFSSVASDCGRGLIACQAHSVELRCMETQQVTTVCCPVVHYPVGASSDAEDSSVGIFSAEPQIYSVEPQVVAAGAGQRIEITGSGFGDSKGNIRWTSADEWGSARVEVTINPPHYISEWTDDRILLSVPSGVGSGPFTVLLESGESVRGRLTVVASLLNGRVSLVSRDGSGGMVFHLNEELPEIARTLFKDAVGQWRSVTGVNLIVASGSVTAQPEMGDSLNVVGYLAPESGQTLGQARIQTRSCGGDSGAYVHEVDLAFSQEAFPPEGNWSESQKTQFLAVALHEIGHAIGLHHFNSSESVMRAVYTSQTDLRLDPGIAGIHWIRSANHSGCGYLPIDWLPAGMKYLSISNPQNKSLRIDSESNTVFFYDLYRTDTLENPSWERIDGPMFGGSPGRFTHEYEMEPGSTTQFFRVMLSSEATSPELYIEPPPDITKPTSQWFINENILLDHSGENHLSQNSEVNAVLPEVVDGVHAAYFSGVGTDTGSSNSSTNPNGNYPYLYINRVPLGSSTPITISGWMKPDPSLDHTSALYYERSTWYGRSQVVIRGGTRIDYEYGDNSATRRIRTEDMPEPIDNGWYHIVATRDDSGMIRLWVNNVYYGETDSNTGTSSAHSLRIGGTRSGAGYFIGYIHDLRIWNGWIADDDAVNFLFEESVLSPD